MNGFAFGLSCPRCGSAVSPVTVGKVCGGTETRAVVRCARCSPRLAEWVVEVFLRPFVDEAVGPRQESDVRRVAPSSALEGVAEWFGLTVDDLAGETRAAHLISPRRVAMLVLQGRGLSLVSIGKELGRDHTTIHHHLKRVTAQERADAERILATLAEAPAAVSA